MLALIVGVLFLSSGVSTSFMIPAPGWFIALDLLVACVPMASLGIRTARAMRPSRRHALQGEA